MRQNIFLSLWLAIFHPQPKVTPSDLALLTGEKWQGTLTYLDYTSNTKETILADLTVAVDKKDKNIWYFKQEYPKEPHANSIDTLVIARDKHAIDGETVIEKKRVPSNGKKIITEKLGGDMKYYRYTYLISNQQFTLIKEEKGQNDDAFFERNRYEYKRKPSK
ncbi:MAG: hypothetical protein ACKVTZ_00790 [Bacteroidia bacterium]